MVLLEIGNMKIYPSVSMCKTLLELVLLIWEFPSGRSIVGRTGGTSNVLFIETRLNSKNISCSNAESWDPGQQKITRCPPKQDGCDALDPQLPIWTLKNENGSIIVPARVPGSVHLVRKALPD